MSFRTSPLARAACMMVGAAAIGSAQTGRMVVDTIRSSALANRFATPAETPVSIYLPPSYDHSGTRRYPVVYLLHGYETTGFDVHRADGSRVGFEQTADAAIAAGSREMIVVIPNASNRLKGSFYVNSAATGMWDDFIARDLVAWIDKSFRTIARPESRGIAGHSMGGFGALYLGMRHGGTTYGAMYAMSPCCSGPVAPFDSTRDGPLWDALAATPSVEALLQGPFRARISAAMSAAFAPDTGRPPFFFDPLEVRRDGHWVQDPAVARDFAEHTPLLMIADHRANLAALRGIQLDIGTKDNLVDPREVMRLDSAMTKEGLRHVFETFDGDHVNRIAVRLRDAVFPFFSRTLVFESGTSQP